jgi:branched-subunit amino acid transport protein
MTWTAVLALAAGTYLLRLGGILLQDRVTMPERLERLVDVGATALLVGLVATAALTEAGGFSGWARPAGVLVGGIAAWRKVPFVLVVILAAGTTAGLRIVGVE